MSWLNSRNWLLDLAWLLLLLAMLRHYWQKKHNLSIAQSWIKTKGHVITCQWIKVGHSLWPKIEYGYHVGDVEMIGEHLFLESAANNPASKYSRAVAYKTAVAFKESSDIDVYYNPDDPTQSALDIAVPYKLYLILIVICLLIAVQVGVLIFRYLLH